MVTRTGVEVDPLKTAAVDNWPEPETIKDVRSFLGLASDYCMFLKDFATVAVPMVALSRKECARKVVWTSDCDIAFNTQKEALVWSPVLGCPLREGRLYVSTDASNDG